MIHPPAAVLWILIALQTAPAAAPPEAEAATPPSPEDPEVIVLTADELGTYRPVQQPVLQDVEAAIVEQTNALRKEHTLPPLATEERLTKTARELADYTARTDRYGHKADGRTPSQRAGLHEYPFCLIAENIAYSFASAGYGTKDLAKTTFDGWLESPPHRRNMLRPHVTEIGVAMAQSSKTGVFYAVQVFARPQSAALRFEISNSATRTATYTLGTEEFSLSPRQTRTHQICTPEELRLRPSKEATPALQPESGDRFVVREVDGELMLQADGDEQDKKPVEKPVEP